VARAETNARAKTATPRRAARARGSGSGSKKNKEKELNKGLKTRLVAEIATASAVDTMAENLRYGLEVHAGVMEGVKQRFIEPAKVQVVKTLRDEIYMSDYERIAARAAMLGASQKFWESSAPSSPA
jgi:hypothetical protein